MSFLTHGLLGIKKNCHTENCTLPTSRYSDGSLMFWVFLGEFFGRISPYVIKASC